MISVKTKTFLIPSKTLTHSYILIRELLMLGSPKPLSPILWWFQVPFPIESCECTSMLSSKWLPTLETTCRDWKINTKLKLEPPSKQGKLCTNWISHKVKEMLTVTRNGHSACGWGSLHVSTFRSFFIISLKGKAIGSEVTPRTKLYENSRCSWEKCLPLPREWKTQQARDTLGFTWALWTTDPQNNHMQQTCNHYAF